MTAVMDPIFLPKENIETEGVQSSRTRKIHNPTKDGRPLLASEKRPASVIEVERREISLLREPFDRIMT